MTSRLISHFTPGLMEHETLEATLVQRGPLADRIVELVRETATGGSTHHLLLVGPRGIGKSHMIALVQHRLRAMEDLNEQLLLAWMREEEWGVASLLDLLVRIIRCLCDTYKDEQLCAGLETLYTVTPQRAEEAAKRLLIEYAGERTVLVLLENLDEIFGGLDDIGQKQLRAFLQENHQFALVCTAPSLFSGVSSRDNPFFGFFQIEHLKPLTFDEAVQMLANIADHIGDEDLAEMIRTETGRARIRAVHHLAGGVHRIYVVFFEFLTRDSLEQLVDPFMKTLDELTAYYQSRMQWLSPQQRKIVELFCEQPGAITVKDIAARCFMTQQTASSHLRDLSDKDYVTSTKAGRESHYELLEPLMRLSLQVKANRGEPIGLFVEFLRVWYSSDQLQGHLQALDPSAAIEREYMQHALERNKEEGTTPHIQACLRDLETHCKAGDGAEIDVVLSELRASRPGARVLRKAGAAVFGADRYDQALACADEVLEHDQEDFVAWVIRAAALGRLGGWEDALSSARRAVRIRPDNAGTELAMAMAHAGLRQWTDARAAFDHAVELFGGLVPPSVWADRAKVLWYLGEWTGSASDATSALRAWHDTGEVRETAAWLGQAALNLGRADVPPTVIRGWHDEWREVVGDDSAFAVPFRLLDTVIRYRETEDVRVLLELPIEERKIVEQMLGLVDEDE